VQTETIFQDASQMDVFCKTINAIVWYGIDIQMDGYQLTHYTDPWRGILP